MKKKLFMALLYGMMIFASPANLYASSNEAPEKSYSPISDGYVYDQIFSINQNFDLSESQNELKILYDTTNDFTSSDVRSFFIDAAQILGIEDLSDYYDSFTFNFIGKDTMELFSVTEYEDIYNFKTTYVGPISSDKDVKEYFPVFYYALFGSKDISASLSKTMHEFDPSKYELPSTYQAGYLWSFFNFGEIMKRIVVDKTSIDIEVFSSNTYDNGKKAWDTVELALDMFNSFREKDPESMPYTKISIKYEDSVTKKALWDLVIEKKGSIWSTTTNQATGDFLQGVSDS